MKKVTYSFLLWITCLSSVNVLADVLLLKDGQTLTGTLISRSADELVFEVSGQQLSFDAQKVQSISFDDATPLTNQGNTKKTEPKNITDTKTTEGILPIGTRVVVKTNKAINSNQHKIGHKFVVRLEANLVSKDIIIAPRGAAIYGEITQAKQSGRLLGKASLQLTITDIMINNQMKPIQTSQIKVLTENTGKSTVNRTARLAAIGGLANGSEGARNMAKVGVGASLLTRGNSINIPAGTLLEFQLAQPLSSVNKIN